MRHAVWAWQLVKHGKHWEVAPAPCDCEACGDEDRASFGCGFVGLDGRGATEWTNGVSDPWVRRTCPRYCSGHEDVQGVIADAVDYERGGLGDVLQLDAAYLSALRAAAAERAAWKDAAERRASGGASGD